jgi:hypothetical protein
MTENHLLSEIMIELKEEECVELQEKVKGKIVHEERY